MLVRRETTRVPMMNDIARQLRAQIPSSTDPDRLEQLAREAEGQTYPRENRRTVKNARARQATVARSDAAFVAANTFQYVEVRLSWMPLP
jgi:hypothetical protein